MDNEKLYRRKGKNVFRVDKAFNIKISPTYNHLDYHLLASETQKIRETGLITLFTLKRKIPSGPSFVGRWDENKSVLDVDILGVDKETETKFKLGKDGYSGHHPERISISPRLFRIDIKIPGQDIFQGEVSFNVNHGHEPGLFG